MSGRSIWQVEVRSDHTSEDWRPSRGRCGLTQEHGEAQLLVAREELHGLYECRLVEYAPAAELREALSQQKLLTQAGLEKLAAVGRWAETWRLSPGANPTPDSTRTRRYCAGVLADILAEPAP